MSFVTAWLAIAGLTAISVPILVHLLLRRRRRPIEWGAMRLLLEAVRRHRRRARIEQILLLAIRCLIVLLVGLALAEPIVSGFRSLGGGSRLVVLVIDDGLISGLQDDDGTPELERTITSAREMIDQLDSGDRVALVTTSHPPRTLTDGITANLEAVDRLLENLEPASGRSDLPGALDIANGLVREHAADAPTTVALMGSWREGSFGGGGGEDSMNDLSKITWPEDRPIQFLVNTPTQERVTMLAVSRVMMRRPVDSTRLEQPPVRTTVTVRRIGGDLEAGRSVVRIEGPGIETTPPRQVEWYPGRSEAIVEFSGRADATNAAVDGTSVINAFVDDMRLPDLARRSILVDTSRTIQVGLIDRQAFTANQAVEQVRSADWIERSLEPGSEGIVEVNRIDPASLSSRVVRGLDALVLARPDLITGTGWDIVVDFVDSGGFLLTLPPTDLQAHPWLDRMSERFDINWDVEVEVDDHQEPLELAVDQPGGSFISMLDSEIDELAAPVEVFKSLNVDPGSGDGRTLLVASDGSPILISWEPTLDRNGAIALLTTAPHLDWTTLPIKPLMVPLMQELIREGTAIGRFSTELQVGDKPRTSVNGVREFSGPGGVLVSVDQSGQAEEPLERTGQWVARDAGGTAMSMVVVNANIDAGDPTLVAEDELQSRLGVDGTWNMIELEDMASRFQEDERSRTWSLVLLAIALLLLILETAMNRWFSRSRVQDDRNGPRVSVAGGAS
jgi:hypothetical protein